MSSGWIAVDLDGCLAQYDKWIAADVIGEPIPVMVERVKQWIEDGYDVRIFTARISHDGTPRRIGDASLALDAIHEWCWKHIGVYLPVTNVKDYDMIELWDDRCVQVEKNTGRQIGISCLGQRKTQAEEMSEVSDTGKQIA